MQLVLSKTDHVLKHKILQPVSELIQFVLFRLCFYEAKFAVGYFFIFIARNH